MASAVTLAGDWMLNIGNRRQTTGTGNLGTYATNGVAITAAQVGLGVLEQLIVSPAAGYVFEWDKTNGKIKAYDQKDPAAAGGADIALPEVGNAVNLAAITFRFQATGV